MVDTVVKHIFVINLDRSTSRMANYNESPPIKLTGKKIKYTRFPAVDGSKLSKKECDKMISLWTISKKHQQNKMGIFLSHMKLLRHIVKKRLNGTLILEDDADLRNVKIPKKTAKLDGICFFGGWATSNKVKDQHLPLRFNPIYKGDNKPVINTIDKDNYRIIQARAYYIPNWKIARELVNFIDGYERVRAVDIMFERFPKTKYFLFPAVSTNRVGAGSTRDVTAKNMDDLLYYVDKKQMKNLII